MHLSIQIQAQAQAEKMIHQWGEEAQVQIGDVRYHLLRNGLVLRDIRILRGDDSVSIEHMLVRANPELLTSSRPRIGRVELSGIHAAVHASGELKGWQHDQRLNQIWRATSSLLVEDGRLSLYLNNQATSALELDTLHLRQRVVSSVRTLSGSARVQDGSLDWEWHLSTDNNDAAKRQWLGALNWHNLNVETLTRALALQPARGLLNGQLAWKKAAPQANQEQQLNLHGEIRLNTVGNSESSNGHHLEFAATKSDAIWKVNMDAIAWPLGPWSENLPAIGGRKLISAQIDGSSLWRGRPGEWKISGGQGELQDVTYADRDDADLPAWYWNSLRYQDLSLDMQKHSLHVKQLSTRDSRLALNIQQPQSQQEGNAPDNREPGIPEPERPDSREQAGNWHISAERIDVHNMLLAARLAQGNIKLPGLNGRCDWLAKQPLNFRLRSATTAEENQPELNNKPNWSLRGTASRNQSGMLDSASMTLRGKNIPASHLRPLLPLQDDSNGPVKLTALSRVNARLNINQALWQLNGKTTFSDLSLSQAGKTWQMKELNLHFGPIGQGLETQRIDKFEALDWHYSTALTPLPPYSSEEDQSPAAQQGPDTWWLSAILNHNMQIRNIRLKNGSISIGNRDFNWAEDMDIEIDGIERGRWSDIRVRGELGTGDMQVDGQWDMLSSPGHFTGTARLEHATPFFLHDWMAASGIPRLIRGRLSASLKASNGKEADSYQSNVRIQLINAQAEAGTFAADPMLARTGYNTYDLLRRLEQGKKKIELDYHMQGQWSDQPLNPQHLGSGLQQALRQAALSTEQRKAKSDVATAKPVIETQVRLHESKRLSQNERIRIFKVVKKLRRNPELIVELKAKWSGEELTAEMHRRIGRTQRLIEKYMTHRRIGKQRIFPVWASPEDKANEIGSIQIITRMPG